MAVEVGSCKKEKRFYDSQTRSLISLKSTTMALDAFNIFNHKRTQRPVLKEPASQKISDKRNSEGKYFNSRRNACT